MVGFAEGPARSGSGTCCGVRATTGNQFLVANRAQLSQETTNEVSGKRTPPVSLLTVSVPVQFQITNLLDWAYNNEDAPALSRPGHARGGALPRGGRYE